MVVFYNFFFSSKVSLFYECECVYLYMYVYIHMYIKYIYRYIQHLFLTFLKMI